MNKAHTLPSFFAKTLSKALNKLIEHDQQAKQKLPEMAGKVVNVIIMPMEFNLPLQIEADKILLLNRLPEQIDTTISGKPTSLFAMSRKQHISGLEAVQINGDATAGQFIADFLKQLDPDREQMICQVLGDEFGYRVSETLKSSKQFGERFIQSLLRSGKEFLLYENQELIRPEEMEQFLDDVDDLKSEVEHLEQHISRLSS